MGRLQDSYAAGAFHDAHDCAEDIMLFRIIRNNGPYQDRHRQRHQDTGIQQAAEPPAGILLTAEERRHHSPDERRRERDRVFHHEFSGHAHQESDPHHILFRDTHSNKLAAHPLHNSCRASHGMGHERHRKEAQEEVARSAGEVERHHVAA